MTDPNSTQTHWTEDQFSDYVLGLATDHAASLRAMRHLDTCAACRQELEHFQESMVSFNQVSLAWSDRQPQKPLNLPEARPFAGWLPTAAWAMAAGLAVSVGLPLALEHRSANPASVASASMPSVGTQIASVDDENSPAAIERDNRMMMAVAVELNRTEPTVVIYDAQNTRAPKRHAQARSE